MSENENLARICFWRDLSKPVDSKGEKILFLVHHIFGLTEIDASYARTQAGPGLIAASLNPALVSQNKIREIRDFLDMIDRWPGEKLDIFATLFASWNDLIIWHLPTTDEAILHEALDNWHLDRQLISRPTWIKTLKWMREVGFAPTGFGSPTKQIDQPRLSLD